MISFLAALVLQAASQVRSGLPRPDVVVFVADDVGLVDVDTVMGRGWMPNLEQIAAEGVSFRRFYTHAKCAPTRDSFEFGRYLGQDRGDHCAPPTTLSHQPSDFSFADMMAGQGYATCLIGKSHTGADRYAPWEFSDLARGWASTRAVTPVGPTCNVPGSSQPQLDDGVYSTSSVDSSVRCRDAFIDWWQEYEGRPRFVVVNFGSAHSPFKYPPASIRPPGYPVCGARCTNREEYEAEIAGIDFVMGQMLSLVGPEDWVVFFGDNGTPGFVPGEDPGVTDATLPTQDPLKVKLSCYEGGVNVPLVIRGPGVKAGHTSQRVTHVAEIMPTFAQILGLQVPVEARSFAPALLGLSGATSPVFVWNGGWALEPPRRDAAMIGPRWKLLTTSDGFEYLFDLDNDPGEQNPLPPVGPEADALRAAREAILSGG